MSSTMFNKPLDTEFVGTVNGLSERIDDVNNKIGTVPSGQTVEGQIENKVNTSAIANNLTTTAAGYVLDARQGKTLNDNKQPKIQTMSITNTSTSANGYFTWNQLKGKTVVGIHVYPTNDGDSIWHPVVWSFKSSTGELAYQRYDLGNGNRASVANINMTIIAYYY